MTLIYSGLYYFQAGAFLQLERKPIAEANTALSVANWLEAIRVPQALGLDPRAANLVSQIASQGKHLYDKHVNAEGRSNVLLMV